MNNVSIIGASLQKKVIFQKLEEIVLCVLMQQPICRKASSIIHKKDLMNIHLGWREKQRILSTVGFQR